MMEWDSPQAAAVIVLSALALLILMNKGFRTVSASVAVGAN